MKLFSTIKQEINFVNKLRFFECLLLLSISLLYVFYNNAFTAFPIIILIIATIFLILFVINILQWFNIIKPNRFNIGFIIFLLIVNIMLIINKQHYYEILNLIYLIFVFGFMFLEKVFLQLTNKLFPTYNTLLRINTNIKKCTTKELTEFYNMLIAFDKNKEEQDNK